ncbi:MAG: TraR/DksA family transcriptional regulator [Paracoccaceae bacterium]
MDDSARHKAGIEARLQDLTRRMQRIEAELDAPPAQDWEDLAIEREDDEALEGVGLAFQAEERRLRAALARIADGSYGTCTRCGGAVEPERLAAVPETPFCQSCAIGQAAGTGG